MRVAIVQESIDPGRGGAETSTLEMGRALAKLGAEIEILTAAQYGDTPRVDGTAGLTLVSIPVGRGSKFRRTVQFLAGVDAHCETRAFEIVHSLIPCSSANIYQPRGGTFQETIARSIAVGRGPLGRALKRMSRLSNFRQRFLCGAEPRMLRERKPFVAAVSDYVRRQILDIVPGYPGERIRVVFNGVGLTRLAVDDHRARRVSVRSTLGIDDRAPVLLFVAHNFRLKGLEELLRAIAAAGPASADWQTLIAGRDRREYYEGLAKRLQLGPRVRFLDAGFEPRDLYCTADVLAHPTFYDPCSRVVLEALCCGLPVVTTRFNGAAEVVVPGRSGAVVADPRDTAALGDALVRTLNPDIAAACQADMPRMRSLLSMERHARELLSLYQAAVAAGMSDGVASDRSRS